MSDFAQMFGRRIARARHHHGWSCAELGRKTGISGKNIASYERGENVPGVFRARALADALGLSLDALTAPAQCVACDGMPPAGMTCRCGAEGPEVAL